MRGALREIDLDDAAWVRFVESQPSAMPFHSPVWGRMVADCYGYHASALVLGDDNGELIAGLPLVRVERPWLGTRGISLPFTDNCAPLACDEQSLCDLSRALADWHSAPRAPLPLAVRGAVPEIGGWRQHIAAVLHTRAISADSAAVFRTFKKTQVRQCVLKAERDGVTVRRGASFADLRIFYNLHLQTRRRLGTPVQPLRFFRLLWERVLEPGLGFVLLAMHEGEPIAGAVFLAWNRTLVYKYGASDARFRLLRPNHLVLWSAIRWGCENGIQTVDFGRTDLDNHGLRDFKNGWGTTEVPLIYSALNGQTPSGRARLATVATRTLSALIRHTPAWVCRGLGEVLYRYAA